MPKNPTRFALRIALPVMILSGFQPSVLLGQQSPARFAVRLQGGVAVMPLQAAEEILGVTIVSRYDNPRPDFFGGAAIAIRLAPGHALSIEVENLANAISLYGFQIGTIDTGAIFGGQVFDQVDGTFTAIPVTLNYTLHFSIRAGGWSSYIRIGLSYYLMQFRSTRFYLYEPQDLSSLSGGRPPSRSVGLFPYLSAAQGTQDDRNGPYDLSSQPGEILKRDWTGYGLALAAGVEFPLSGHLYLSNQLRYRWAEGNTSDELGFIKVWFNGFDLSIGLAWHI